ncbi:MAG TPA: dienelactone hydrolase family protein [Candidatus Aquilonibacter sp.]|nr:dienelactone hydrolase family protein [Candidatus Aquilonibacter sp.]
MVKIATQEITLQVSDGTSMNAYAAHPEAPGKVPGMLVLQEAFGVNAHIRDITERMAREGYVAIAPELFHRTASGFEGTYDNFPAVMPHIQALTEAGQAADIRAAYDWLRANRQVSADRVASIGFCMGGRASFLADALLPLQASISFYGGGIAQALLPRAKDLHAPILLFWGGLDHHITQEHTRAVEDALKAAEKPYVNVTVSYADHGFFCDARASYNPAAAGLAWKLTLQFLDTYVKGTAATAHA